MADVSIEAVSAVVGKVYEAAYDQERWFDAVTGLRNLFGGSRSCIVRISPHTFDAVASDFDPEFTSQRASKPCCAIRWRRHRPPCPSAWSVAGP